MKVYVVMWGQRVGKGGARNWVDNQAFSSRTGANKRIEGEGLNPSNSKYGDRYSDYGRGLYAWVEELTLTDAIETKDGIVFMGSKE